MIILFLDKWQKAESEKVLKTIKAIQAARSKRKCSCSWACQRFCNIKEIKEKHQRHKTELRQCSTSYNYIWILHLSVLYHVNQTVPGLLLLWDIRITFETLWAVEEISNLFCFNSNVHWILDPTTNILQLISPHLKFRNSFPLRLHRAYPTRGWGGQSIATFAITLPTVREYTLPTVRQWSDGTSKLKQEQKSLCSIKESYCTTSIAAGRSEFTRWCRREQNRNMC